MRSISLRRAHVPGGRARDVHGGIACNVVPDECVPGQHALRARHVRAGRRGKRPAQRPRHGELVIDGNAPSGRSPSGPLARPQAAGGDLTCAQAGMDAGRGVGRRGVGHQLRSGHARTRTAATSRSRWRPWSVLQRWSGSCAPEPGPGVRLGTYPFVRLDEARPRRARGHRADRLRDGRAARGDARRSSARALVEAIEPVSPYPKAVGLPELRDAVAGWIGRRFGATVDPDTQVIPTLGSKEADLRLAKMLSTGDGRGRRHARAIRSRARRRCSRASEVVELPLTAANGWLPDLDAVGDAWVAARRAVAQLPEQPDRRGRAAGVLRARRRAGARARLRARLRRGVLGAVVRRRRAGVRAAGRRPHHVSVFNTLSKRSSMPGYRVRVRGGRPAS